MDDTKQQASIIDRVIRFCLENKLVVTLAVIFMVGWGIAVAPFDWELKVLSRNPVPVDAIPDIGENQQIVFTQWPGRSPQDVDDQITYPLTVFLLGIPEVKTIRSQSMFGFSSIYIIFNEKAEFYWSRSRVLEKLNSLPAGTLPEGVQPMLGPDATALGQIFWYTLEGRDKQGNPAGGWDLDELRTIQDWHVRYALMSAEGISEVASVGGFVREYQIDVDPDAMRAYGVGLDEIFRAVSSSNIDVGARTIEINKVEYVIRGLGFIKGLGDIEKTVVKVSENVPVYIRDIAHVTYGPALRRGALDKGGAEAVGGVAVVRYGHNPLAAIKNVKEKIEEISPGLPEKTLADGTISKVTIVPFYDRTGLIYETLGTLETALTLEILVTVIVVIVMVAHLRSSMLISALLPLALFIIFLILYFQFKSVATSLLVFSGIIVAWAGGFLMIWAYAQPWFLDFSVFGVNMRELFQMHPINLSVAIWVGFLALFGIASDDGVVMCTYISQSFSRLKPANVQEVREAVVAAGTRRIRPCLMTTATTILALIPVLTSTGRGSDIMVPMAIPSFGGMTIEILTMLIVPVLYCAREELKVRRSKAA